MRMDSIKGSNKYKYATTPLDPSYTRTTCLGVALSGCGVPRCSLARRRGTLSGAWWSFRVSRASQYYFRLHKP
jgi:hypothetical protein